MDIAIFANFGLGLFNFRSELISRLIHEGYNVTIVYPFDEYQEKFTELGCKLIDINLSRRGMNPLEDLSYMIQVNKILKQYNFDMILTYTIKPNIYVGIIAGIHRKNYVTNVTGLGSTFENDGLINRLVINLYKLGLRKSKKVYFQNKSNLEIFRKYNIVKDNFTLIPGSGVNIDKFNILEYPDNEQIIFLFIGRLMRDKGIYELIEAFESLEDREIKLNIIGFAEEEIQSYIEEKTNQNKYTINYLGYKTNIIEDIKICDAVINPSYHEGMSNVLLEAGASGRPLLASNIPGCREIIVNGETGFLFDSKSKESIIHTIKKFKKKSRYERKVMGIKSREFIESRYDRQLVTNSYLNTIREILDEKRNK